MRKCRDPVGCHGKEKKKSEKNYK